VPTWNPHSLRLQQQQPSLPRRGHCVSSRTDRYFTKQKQSLGSSQHLAQSTRQMAYALDTFCLKA
jgi:hypothetical protein